MEYRDYYKTLGVPKGAGQAEIKKAFRKLARKHHPDVNAADPAAEGRFKEVNEAYAVLGDADKRKAYDTLGADWEAYQRAGAGAARTGTGPFAGFGGGAGGGSGAFPGGIRFEYRGDPADLAGFSDFFRTFFAGGAAGADGGVGASRGRRQTTTRTMAGDFDIDTLLGGLGAAGDGRAPHGASAAGGSQARRAVPRRTPTAEVEVSLEEVASGTHRLVQVGDRLLEVQIPAGVESGQRIRLSGAAAGGDGGPIHLAVAVKPHPIFARDGANLTRELPITLGEALLGAEVPVETISGRKLLLTIPSGTQSGRTFRLAGQGLPRFRADGRGDLYARTRVVLPQALDEKGRRLARDLTDHIAQPSPRAGRGAASTNSHGAS
jgi:DnaJ-class molecular chaperone